MPATRWIALALLLCCAAARGADPSYARVNFQGRLSDPTGNPVTNGAYDMMFKFYDGPAAGTLLLADRHAAGVTGALYSVLLGGGQILAGAESNLWNVFLKHPEVYLGVSVNAESEMTPRLLLARTPYAVRADDALTLAGRPITQFIQTSNANTLIAGTLTLNGNMVTSGRYAFNSTRVGRVTLGPADFVPRHPFEEQYILWGYPWKTNRHYLISTMQTGFSTFHADVHVPEGAIMTKLVSYIYDVDTARTSILNLARCSLYGHLGPDPVYLGTNSSVDNQTRVERPLSEVVNTTTNHYVLTLQLLWSDVGMQFFGAQVEYTYSELKN
jgi:hypothetical protein